MGKVLSECEAEGVAAPTVVFPTLSVSFADTSPFIGEEKHPGAHAPTKRDVAPHFSQFGPQPPYPVPTRAGINRA